MVPVEVFEELTGERARSLSQAVSSVRAEGLEVGARGAGGHRAVGARRDQHLADA